MISVDFITPANAPIFKSIRLRALQESPTAFGSTYAKESLLSDADWQSRAAQCTNATSVGYLAMDAGRACGIARATPDDDDPSVAWLESMWVAPSHRRQGIGRFLIETIVDWAGRRGIRILKLDVTCTNEPAIGLYANLGFVPTGKTVPYVHDPALVECEMVRTLSQGSGIRKNSVE